MNIQYAADWSDVLRKTNPIMFENRNRTNAFKKSGLHQHIMTCIRFLCNIALIM